MEYKVSASDVSKLRQLTGAGMMDCKKALVEANGDIDVAIDELRKKGIAKAAKRSDREATEGVAIAATIPNQTRAVLLSINCETDFVARNEDFLAMANKIVQIAMDSFPETKEELANLPYSEGLTIGEKLTEQTGIIGEKIEIGAYEKMTGAQILPYNHSNKKLAVILGINKRENAFEEAAYNLAMQVAAMGPVSVSSDDVPADIIEKELEIGKDLAINEGKPAAMAEKIAQGRLQKFFKENTLLSQKYVKNGDVTVDEYLRSLDKDLTVTAFKRISL